MEKAKKKDRGHQRYRLRDGTIVPGVTTIVGVMAKPALINWANRMGLQGIDTTKYVDSLADAGTLAHYLVECDLVDEEPDPAYLDEFSKVDLDRAENSLLSYYEWRKQHEIEIIGTEMQLVSEEHGFGGTCDIYCKLDGRFALIDIKTCKALYGKADEKWTQVAGYSLLLEENFHKVDAEYILRIGREESEGFEFVESPDPLLHSDRFFTCLELYNINKRLRG